MNDHPESLQAFRLEGLVARIATAIVRDDGEGLARAIRDLVNEVGSALDRLDRIEAVIGEEPK